MLYILLGICAEIHCARLKTTELSLYIIFFVLKLKLNIWTRSRILWYTVTKIKDKVKEKLISLEKNVGKNEKMGWLAAASLCCGGGFETLRTRWQVKSESGLQPHALQAVPRGDPGSQRVGGVWRSP
jgi:hypothetical protein